MAHHDHEGIKKDQTYFGADDNASGCAGLLGIAEAFSTLDKPLRRGVIFLSSGAEEKGSLGARYFLQNPPFPPKNIVAVINMDMIGRDGSSQFRAMMDPTIEMEEDLLMGFYSGQTPLLAEVASRENRTAKLNLVLEPVLRFHSASDHVPFHEKEIPSIFLFTGFHGDYTSPNDTPDKILYGKLVRVVQLAFGMSYDLAERKERTVFDKTITEVKRSDRRYGY
jgi:Zn-dependent M28 family amino/carboxypeptidase